MLDGVLFSPLTPDGILKTLQPFQVVWLLTDALAKMRSTPALGPQGRPHCHSYGSLNAPWAPRAAGMACAAAQSLQDSQPVILKTEPLTSHYMSYFNSDAPLHPY